MGLGVDKELDHAYKNGVEELGIMHRLFHRIHRFCWFQVYICIYMFLFQKHDELWYSMGPVIPVAAEQMFFGRIQYNLLTTLI